MAVTAAEIIEVVAIAVALMWTVGPTSWGAFAAGHALVGVPRPAFGLGFTFVAAGRVRRRRSGDGSAAGRRGRQRHH